MKRRGILIRDPEAELPEVELVDPDAPPRAQPEPERPTDLSVRSAAQYTGRSGRMVYLDTRLASWVEPRTTDGLRAPHDAVEVTTFGDAARRYIPGREVRALANSVAAPQESIDPTLEAEVRALANSVAALGVPVTLGDRLWRSRAAMERAIHTLGRIVYGRDRTSGEVTLDRRHEDAAADHGLLFADHDHAPETRRRVNLMTTGDDTGDGDE